MIGQSQIIVLTMIISLRKPIIVLTMIDIVFTV